ncbi:hypothetical protein ACFVHW_04530 [Streptomyces sp. NPDC127110]|uniref:hypothetical protein n=1 Tax=Streptomyces sp. NPDC127110 TaxID=3345362 RepID=UPI003638380F
MWDSVPWFIEGGAEHTSEVARLLAYTAVGGAEGIVGSADLRVQPLTSPAAAVQLMTGACAITNRAPGATAQSYVARLPVAEQVPVAATGVSPRSDLVIARIENPYSQGESWPLPANPKVGPYVSTRIISGVPNTTTDIRQVRPGDSAITLARIDLPANTSSVTGAMITDLRDMVSPRRERRLYPLFAAETDGITAEDDRWYDWPKIARINVKVPSWATRYTVMTTVCGLKFDHANVRAGMVHQLGGIWGEHTEIDDNGGLYARRQTVIIAHSKDIPASMRGTVQPLYIKTIMFKTHTGDMYVDEATAIVHDVEWQEAPTLDPGL